jgi:hypothetical protein
MSYRLYIKDSGTVLGTITDEQLDELIDLLEEEDSEDHDYYIDKDVLAFLEEEGADEALLALIRPHVTGDDGIEIEWKEEAPPSA